MPVAKLMALAFIALVASFGNSQGTAAAEDSHFLMEDWAIVEKKPGKEFIIPLAEADGFVGASKKS